MIIHTNQRKISEKSIWCFRLTNKTPKKVFDVFVGPIKHRKRSTERIRGKNWLRILILSTKILKLHHVISLPPNYWYQPCLAHQHQHQWGQWCLHCPPSCCPSQLLTLQCENVKFLEGLDYFYCEMDFRKTKWPSLVSNQLSDNIFIW